MKAAFCVTEQNSPRPHSSQLQAEALVPLGGLEEESLETRSVWAPHIPAAPHIRLGYWGTWASNRFPKATTESQKKQFGGVTCHFLNRQLIAHTCHGCLVPQVPSFVAEDPLQRWTFGSLDH